MLEFEAPSLLLHPVLLQLALGVEALALLFYQVLNKRAEVEVTLLAVTVAVVVLVVAMPADATVESSGLE